MYLVFILPFITVKLYSIVASNSIILIINYISILSFLVQENKHVTDVANFGRDWPFGSSIAIYTPSGDGCTKKEANLTGQPLCSAGLFLNHFQDIPHKSSDSYLFINSINPFYLVRNGINQFILGNSSCRGHNNWP